MRYLVLFFLMAAATARAQFDVNLTLQRTNFVALEAIQANVIITNRSGTEVVLGGPGRGGWLSFTMSDSEGRPLSPIDVDGSELVQLAAGGTIERRVAVTDVYGPSDVGNYALVARVLHGPSGDFYTSNRARFSIADAKPMYQKTYGVPEGFKDAGKVRKYVLALFRDLDATSLYFRLLDEASGLRLKTFRLGPVSLVHDPQITLDTNNQLQVLFLAQPHIYAHAIISPDGSLKKRNYYKEENGNRPQMIQGAKGEVTIVGGELFDPSAPPPKPVGNTGRSVSDRPPGL